MLYLTSKTLSNETTQHLQEQQQDVNGQSTFEKQVKRAESLWGNKKQNGKKAFDEIETKLKKLGKVQGICNYCEHNRSEQIEHIYPKSLFPNKTFVWENYLHVCGQCNKLKSNKCKIFYPNSTTEQELKGLGVLPSPNEDLVIINARTENPLEFMILDLAGKTFRFVPINDDINSREYKKAHYTIDLLHLNLDDDLVRYRRLATENLLLYFEKCVQIRETQNFEELEKLVDNDFLPLDKSQTLLSEQNRFFHEFKKKIQTSPHPTVWEEMKRQREFLPKTKILFEALPEALKW